MFEGVDFSIVVNAAFVLLAAVIAAVQPSLVKFLKAKADQLVQEHAREYTYLIEGFAAEAVRAAEQLGGTNEQKKQIAVNYVVRRALDVGLDVDPEVVDALIEAMVYGVKPKVGA